MLLLMLFSGVKYTSFIRRYPNHEAKKKVWQLHLPTHSHWWIVRE
jgi:hypothetical protein